MTIELKITTDTVRDLQSEIRELLGGGSAPAPVAVESEDVETVVNAIAAVPEPADPVAEPARRRGRPPKKTEATQEPAPAAPEPQPEEAKAEPITVTASSPAAPKVTLDDVRTELQKVNETKGLETAKELLAKVGAKRLSEIPEDKYAEFVQLCKATA